MKIIYIIKKCFEYVEYRLDPIKYVSKRGASIGVRNTILKPVWGTEPYLISIGDDNLISFDIVFLNHDGSTHTVNKYVGLEKITKFGKIKIGNENFIGCRTIILPNVEIGDRCIVAAGSMVTKSIPSGEVWGGVPAKFIMTTEEYALKCKNSPYHVDLSDMESGKSKQDILLNALVDKEYKR